jgi:hypothetical protein
MRIRDGPLGWRRSVVFVEADMIPKKPAPHLMRGGNRLSEKDHAQTRS